MLEDRAATAPLRPLPTTLNPSVDQVLRITVREAQERPMAIGRLRKGHFTTPGDLDAHIRQCLPDRRVHGLIKGRVGTQRACPAGTTRA